MILLLHVLFHRCHIEFDPPQRDRRRASLERRQRVAGLCRIPGQPHAADVDDTPVSQVAIHGDMRVAAEAESPFPVEHLVKHFVGGRVGEQVTLVVAGRTVVADHPAIVGHIEAEFAVQFAQVFVVGKGEPGDRPVEIGIAFTQTVGDGAAK
jgi:hypothetical protein